jgi:acyl transferase domain-containing protein
MADVGSQVSDIPIAVIGMSARAAGVADPDGLWRLVERGRSAITEVPADRLPGFDAHRLGVATPRAALLDRIDTFDADFFGLSPRQAAFMDPRQRLLLEETWHALEDAGIAPDRLAGSDTGVLVGAAGSDFRLRCDGLGVIDPYTATGTLDALVANRISQHFDLRGCSAVVDTACSAGLSAVSQAVWALAAGQIELAVAAGVQVICHGFDQEAFVKAGILSPSGRVRLFSDDSDGYVRGDGVAVVILKRLADAVRDGDPIRAVIRGVAQSHDGRAGGQFSPEPGVQASLIRRATHRAGVTPAALGYVEAHATGTRAGDRAEALGIRKALAGTPAAAGPAGKLWVGAVKSLIGHTEGAAGLFGLIKAILVLENERIPAIPGLTRLMEDLTADQSPVAFPTHPVAWPRESGHPRLAGVSSFGIGGANVHVVISEPPLPRPSSACHGPATRLFPLSAASSEALVRLATRLADWLENHPRADLDAVAWTLQHGRSALGHRVVLTGEDVASVGRAAVAVGEGSSSPPDPAAARSVAGRTIATFCSGQEVEWAALWSGPAPPHRLQLVPYPFEPRSHWFRAERPPEPLPPRFEEPAGPRTPAAQATEPAAPGGPARRRPQVQLTPPEAYGAGRASPDQPEPGPGADGAAPPEPAPPQQPPVAASAPAASEPAPPAAVAAPAAAAPEPAPPTVGAASAVAAPAPPAALVAQLRQLTGECLYLPPDEVDPDGEFTAIGLDSVLAVEFVAKVNASFSTNLTVANLYEQATLNRLAATLAATATATATATAGGPQ